MSETIIQTKPCVACGAAFSITDADIAFYDKVSPVFAGVKYAIPAPSHCPDCRQQRRLAWRNERKLYKRSCDATGKQIISVYSSDKPYKVYDQKIWRSDGWDPLNYGKEYDFGKNFFEQFYELFCNVPKPSIQNISSENCDYTNYSGSNKNCYLGIGLLNSRVTK